MRFLPPCAHPCAQQSRSFSRPRGPHCGSGSPPGTLEPNPNTRPRSGWAPGALGVTASGGAPGPGAGLGLSEGSRFAGRVPSLRSPPQGATGAWGMQGQPDPTPRTLSFCARRGGQGTGRGESTAGWAGLPRVNGHLPALLLIPASVCPGPAQERANGPQAPA